MRENLSRKCYAIIGILVVLSFGLTLYAQPPANSEQLFSIDFQGPTNNQIDPFMGLPITEGDVLQSIQPGIQPPPPGIITRYGPPGIGLGIMPVVINDEFQELDALSYGFDRLPIEQIMHYEDNPMIIEQLGWFFSVDEFAVGIPGVPGPSVTTEGAGTGGAREASADIYASYNAMPANMAAWGMNKGVYDGNGGATPFPGPGVNLIEPNPPTFGFEDPPMYDQGDNLDALEVNRGPDDVQFPVFFSLDSEFVDPLEGPPANTGTAMANGFVGGDVLMTFSYGGPPWVYAAANMLGLDQNPQIPDARDIDDLDALVLWEKDWQTDPQYIPDDTFDPNDPTWVPAPHADLILYSVRRNSFIVWAGINWGFVDARLGLPIEEGDILFPVYDQPDGIPLFDGIEGDYDPAILIPAEQLGLMTRRSGIGAPWYPTYPHGGEEQYADDLNALDVFIDWLPGDFDWDGDIDCDDIDLLWEIIKGTIPVPPATNPDLNGDSLIDNLDMDFLIQTILATAYGDANLSGKVDPPDLGALLANYGTVYPTSNWCAGDFNGDCTVNALDLGTLLANYGMP